MIQRYLYHTYQLLRKLLFDYVWKWWDAPHTRPLNHVITITGRLAVCVYAENSVSCFPSLFNFGTSLVFLSTVLPPFCVYHYHHHHHNWRSFLPLTAGQTITIPGTRGPSHLHRLSTSVQHRHKNHGLVPFFYSYFVLCIFVFNYSPSGQHSLCRNYLFMVPFMLNSSPITLQMNMKIRVHF